MIASKAELIGFIHREHRRIREFGILRIGLFGSFLRDAATPQSDVDLLVEFAPGRKTFRSFMALALYLEDSLGRTVDLLTPESLSPHIGPKILSAIEYVPLAD